MSEERARHFADSWPMAGIKALSYVAVGIAAFGVGWVATFFALLWVFAPSAACESPCDGGAYVAAGASLVFGTMVGAGVATGAIIALRRFWRRR